MKILEKKWSFWYLSYFLIQYEKDFFKYIFLYLLTAEKLAILIASMYGFKADTWYVLRYLIRDDLNPVSESPGPN